MSFKNGFEKVAIDLKPFAHKAGNFFKSTKSKGIFNPQNMGAGKIMAKNIKAEQHALARKALGGSVEDLAKQKVKQMTDSGIREQIKRNIRDNKLMGTEKIRALRDTAQAGAAPIAKSDVQSQYSKAFKDARSEAVKKVDTQKNWDKARRQSTESKGSWIKRNPIKSMVGTYLGAKMLLGNGEQPQPPPQVVQY